MIPPKSAKKLLLSTIRITEPELTFSHWTVWNHRNEVKNSNLPGVYILARFKSVPTGTANPKDIQIVYIGQTSRTLKRRWSEFNRSSLKGNTGHAGGRMYWKKYKGRVKNLYVAALPVKELPKGTRMPYIWYIESKLIWEYVQKNGKLPSCNRADKKEKKDFSS